MSETDHYFSARADLPSRPRELTLRLAGREVHVTTDNGVFSGERLDLGTQVLLRSVPAPDAEAGPLLDMGCGWGPIALAAALGSPDLDIWAVDVNPRAVALTVANAQRHGLARIRAVAPDEVPPDVQFGTLWSNPPIRIGKDALHDLLRLWLPRLAPEGQAFMVVSKNLGADSLMAWMNRAFPELITVKFASAKGFRVLHTQRRS